MHFIDTQGTNDTTNSDNNAVLSSVFHEFLRLLGSFPTEIHGIIYFHNSHIVDRCHFDLRCKEISKITGDSISKVVLCTKYNDLKKLNQKKLEQNILSKFSEQNIPYVLWDSSPDPDEDEGEV